MQVSLVDVDGHNFPNLALAKISTWHKQQGDDVKWYDPLFDNPDMIYASKVFTFTPDYDFNPQHYEIINKGGTGYKMYEKVLPKEIDDLLPDLSLYPKYDFAYGFLSRGCIRKCDFCVVPKKEGKIRKYCDIEKVAQGRKSVVLMDNNFLANERDFCFQQLDKIIELKIGVDFNQGLDCRLVDYNIAEKLAKVKWRCGTNRYLRFACDHNSVLPYLEHAVKLLRKANYTGEVFCYVLVKDLAEGLERINKITAIDKKIKPFVMPFRNLDGDGKIANNEIKRLARWCNMQSIRNSCKFEDYKG